VRAVLVKRRRSYSSFDGETRDFAHELSRLTDSIETAYAEGAARRSEVAPASTPCGRTPLQPRGAGGTNVSNRTFTEKGLAQRWVTSLGCQPEAYGVT
jgi:hypothetical protein